MFTYQNAYVKEAGRWRQQDVIDQALIDLTQNYEAVVFTVTNPYYDDLRAVALADIPPHYNAQISQETPPEFFARVGNGSLPVTTDFPSLDIVYAPFQDAILSGYTVEPVNRTYNKAMGLPKAELQDLKITRAGVDYKQFFEECLVTVNGFFHRTNYTGESVNVVDGATSGFHANDNHVGIYHLGPVGKVETVPIRAQHIYHNNEAQPLKHKLYIEMDERVGDLSNKSIMVVIGGYLHLLDNDLIRQSGDRLYTLDFAKYHWPQRFYDMRAHLDLSEVTAHFNRSTANADQVSQEDLYSDETIRALFEMSQSFFVIVDTPELLLDMDLVHYNGLPGSFVTKQPPVYPLYAGTGRFYEYWFQKEYDRWALSISGGQRPNYLFETTDWNDDNALDSSRYPARLFDKPQAFFWKLGRYR